jgi:hypothetical protein
MIWLRMSETNASGASRTSASDDVDHGGVVAAVQVDELLRELTQGDQEVLGLRGVGDAERPDGGIRLRDVHRAVDAIALDDRAACGAG